MELILAYQAIKKTPGALLARLKDHATRHSKDYYYRIRKQRPIAPIEIAARFIYLNKTCFNGLYRVNKSGGFNAPMGSYVRPSIFRHDNILACNRVLQNAHVRYGDFEDVEVEIRKGDFIYLDPPYHPTSDASFTKYTKENFTEADQVRLRDFVVRLHKKGAFVMLSNSKTRFIKDLYASDKFFPHTVMAPRTVNCKPLQRDRVEELLITNYPTHHGRSSTAIDPEREPIRKVSHGARANYTGNSLEEFVHNTLIRKGYKFVEHRQFDAERFLDQPIFHGSLSGRSQHLRHSIVLRLSDLSSGQACRQSHHREQVAAVTRFRGRKVSLSCRKHPGEVPACDDRRAGRRRLQEGSRSVVAGSDRWQAFACLQHAGVSYVVEWRRTVTAVAPVRVFAFRRSSPAPTAAVPQVPDLTQPRGLFSYGPILLQKSLEAFAEL